METLLMVICPRGVKFPGFIITAMRKSFLLVFELKRSDVGGADMDTYIYKLVDIHCT